MKRPALPRRAEHEARGFTLIELVVTLVILSIVSVISAGFIITTSESYVATATRNQLASAARLTVDRLALELHNALPNSLRLTTAGPGGDQCLEFVPVRAASTYIDAPFRPRPYVSSFSIVDFVPMQDGVTGAYAVIFPVEPDDLYGAAFAGSTTEAIVEVSVGTGSAGSNTLTSPHPHRFKRQSPVDRVYLVDPPVSFCIAGDRLHRYSDYGFQAVQCTPSTCLPSATPGRWLIANEIDNTGLSAFDYVAASRRRNAVVQLELNFSRNGEGVLLNHEVLIQNAL